MTAPTQAPRKYRADFLTQAAYEAYLDAHNARAQFPADAGKVRVVTVTYDGDVLADQQFAPGATCLNRLPSGVELNASFVG